MAIILYFRNITKAGCINRLEDKAWMFFHLENFRIKSYFYEILRDSFVIELCFGLFRGLGTFTCLELFRYSLSQKKESDESVALDNHSRQGPWLN